MIDVVAQLRIAGRPIGEGQPAYVIAEIGNNHNGNVAEAEALAELAAQAGCDAIKLQHFRGSDVVLPSVESAEYPDWPVAQQYRRWIDFLDSLALGIDGIARVAQRARGLGLGVIVTPASIRALNELIDAGAADAYKVASMDVTNPFLLDYLNLAGLPVVLSTGMATREEVTEASSRLYLVDTLVLHCVSKYPAREDEMNLGRMISLKEWTGRPVGLSDHSLDTAAALRARSMGACCIERHFTRTRNQSAVSEHHFSTEPAEMADLVAALQRVDVEPTAADASEVREQVDVFNAPVYRRGWWFVRDVATGQRVSPEDVAFVRPENPGWPAGVSPVGWRACEDARACEPVRQGSAEDGISIAALSKRHAAALVEALTALDRDAVEHEGSRYDSVWWRNENFLVDLSAKWELSRYAATERGELVGFVIASEFDGGVHLHRVLVAPAYRGFSVGTCLVMDIIRCGSQAKLERVTAEVPAESPRTQRFYERMGFERVRADGLTGYLTKKHRVDTVIDGDSLRETDGHRSFLYARPLRRMELM